MNVVDILEDRNIKYKATNKDYTISCLNPEHEDNNPSLNVDKVTGIFHCFSCGFKGNIFNYFGAEPNFIDQRVVQLQTKISKMLSNRSLDMPLDNVPFNQDYRNISANTYLEVNAFISDEYNMENRVVFPLYNIRGQIKAFIGRSFGSEQKTKYYIYPDHVSLPIFPSFEVSISVFTCIPFW